LPKSVLDPKDKKALPVGLKVAKKDYKWEHVDRLGDFKGIPSKTKPDRLVKGEAERGIKLTDFDKLGVVENVVL
jgi:hypothetical protein